MNDRDRRILTKFKRSVPSELSDRVKKIIVYGSRVRGDATEDSDLDVVALVEEKTPELEEQLEEIAYRVMWEFDFEPIISLKVFAQSRFQDALESGFSFYRNVNDGIAL